MPPLPQCASLAAMKAHIAARHSPLSYVTALHTDLEALGAARTPAHDALLRQADRYLAAGTEDLAAFRAIVGGCFKDSVLTMCEGFGEAIRWHGYAESRADVPLGPETFGQRASCNLRRSNATDWCVEFECRGEEVYRDFGEDRFAAEFLDMFLKGIQTPAVPMFEKRGGLLDGFLEWYRICSLDQLEKHIATLSNVLEQPRHTYGMFDTLDGVLAFVCGERLIGSGIGVFTAHGYKTHGATLVMHDLWHLENLHAKQSASDVIILRMQLYAALCTFSASTLSSSYLAEHMLTYSEGHYAVDYASLFGLFPDDVPTYCPPTELQAFYQHLAKTMEHPPANGPLWTLPAEVVAREQALIQAAQAELPT